MKKRSLTIGLLVGLIAPAARGDFVVRIGDKDGFGYGAAPGFHAANGGLANVNGSPTLDNGDFLPDINRDGLLQFARGDDFDLRSAAEVGNASVSTVGAVTSTAGTIGSKFTDISLSKSYDNTSAANQVLIGGNPNSGLIRGAGGPFPMPPSTTLPNQPGFVFRFNVDKGAVNPSDAVFFNLVFGDYDVTPATIRITKSDGSTRTLSLSQQNNATSDGLIQGAFATLSFGDVFTDAGTSWRGSVNVDFLAPNEPYTAFDYVELSTTRLVPEPASFVILGTGCLGLMAAAWRRRVASSGPRPDEGDEGGPSA